MMKKFFKRLLLFLLVVFIFIQFFHPVKNKSASPEPNNIAMKYHIPPRVQIILENSCYDCHSNNTRYPWYNNIQPVAWWLNDHIKSAKEALNFSEFSSYPINEQYKRFDDLNDEVKKGDMPLPSYTWIHRSSILSDSERLLIANWVLSTRDSMKAIYPADSLIEKN